MYTFNEPTDDGYGAAVLGVTILYALLFAVISKPFNWKVPIWNILLTGAIGGFISWSLDGVIQKILVFTFGIFLGFLHAIGFVGRSFADTGINFLDRIAFWFGAVGTSVFFLWIAGVKGEFYREYTGPAPDNKFGYSKYTNSIGIFLGWIIYPTLFVISIIQTNEINELSKPVAKKRLFKDLPSWSSIANDQKISSMTKFQQLDKFAAWTEKFYACAVDDTENISIEGWQQFKIKMLQTRESILGFPENIVGDIEAVEQQQEDERLKLATRKLQLENRIVGWLGVARSRPELLAPEEREELEWLRGKVTKDDEEALEAVTAVREDKLLYFCTPVRFHASPGLRRDPKKLREIIRKCSLSNRRKANALIMEYPVAGN